jgi:hypothetical protein
MIKFCLLWRITSRVSWPSRRTPSRLREAAHTCEFREVLHRGPKIAACLAERGGFEPPSPFSLWAAENSASSAHYFAKLLRNLS